MKCNNFPFTTLAWPHTTSDPTILIIQTVELESPHTFAGRARINDPVDVVKIYLIVNFYQADTDGRTDIHNGLGLDIFLTFTGGSNHFR
jgi:hypothetical protein